MAAQTQPVPAQTEEELETLRQERVEKLLRLTKEMGEYAESQGMTDEVFAKLLAED